jgi:hypothetical protein
MPRPVYSQPPKDIAQFTRDELPTCPSNGQAAIHSLLRHHGLLACRSGAALDAQKPYLEQAGHCKELIEGLSLKSKTHQKARTC